MSRRSPPAARAEDEAFMRRALALAEQGRGTTHPNPMVGAVIVKRGRVLAEGYHRRAGGPHAEIEALAPLRQRAPGATLYVTLEPCCHQGRTGPCTEPIIASGISRVVVGCRDLNPKVAGRGITRLRRAGLPVEVGLLEEECRALNRAFFRWIAEGRPWVTLKAAATLDGYIAPPAGRQTSRGIHWITNDRSRAVAHELRAAHQAILVGAGTVLTDDPRLDVRPPGRPADPLRVVLDGRLRTPPGAQLLRLRGKRPPLVLTATEESLPVPERASHRRRRQRLVGAGAELLPLPADRQGRIPLPRVLAALAARGVQSLLVEGGHQIHGLFIAARLVDEVAFFFAPRLVGAGQPIADGPGLPFATPLRLGPLAAREVAGDILLTASVIPEG